MILVVGGMASGKRTFVESLGFGPDSWADGLCEDAAVLVEAQELVRGDALAPDVFDALCAKAVVVCLEVGAGVVPMDAEERAWRERVGRMCIGLAERATCVVRMVCGCPVVLKGSIDAIDAIGEAASGDDAPLEAEDAHGA